MMFKRKHLIHLSLLLFDFRTQLFWKQFLSCEFKTRKSKYYKPSTCLIPTCVMQPLVYRERIRHPWQRCRIAHERGIVTLLGESGCIEKAEKAGQKKMLVVLLVNLAVLFPVKNMYLLTEWEGRTGKYLARGQAVPPDRESNILPSGPTLHSH